MLVAVVIKFLVIFLLLHYYHLMFLFLVLHQACLHLQQPSFDVDVGLLHLQEFWNDSMLKQFKVLAIKIEINDI